MPSVGSYFGGDLIAGILSTGLDQAEEPCMLIDVGTNAEVLVGNRDWLIACAGAAGPALEGGVVEMGMRAGPGAIEHVEIDPESGELTYTTVDNGPAAGICGSGMIDLMAGLYLARIFDIRVKFKCMSNFQLQLKKLDEWRIHSPFLIYLNRIFFQKQCHSI